jgi:iron(III) transport system ATP-binding protein
LKNTNAFFSPHILSIRDLGLSYDSELVLKDIDIDVNPGELICILGPSGSGKTTLLRAIAGFLPVANGSIDIKGQRVSGVNNTTPPNERSV